MIAEIYWITDFLATMPHPRGNDWLEDEVIFFKNSGVDVIVSLLERDEIIELELEKERSVCRECGIEFFDFPVTDFRTPESFDETFRLVKRLHDLTLENKKVAIHCRQGGGRSSLIAACVLALQGVKIRAAFDLISEKRGYQVPDTNEQVEWAEQFAEKFL